MEAQTNPPPSASANDRIRLRAVRNTLVVFAVLGLIAAIVIPTAASRRTPDPRSFDFSNLRLIGQAARIYASDHQDQLPQTEDIHAFAVALAQESGLNDAWSWITSADYDLQGRPPISTVLTPDRATTEPAFSAIRPSFAAAVRGLHAKLPATTPIAWTRGLRPDGTWAKDSPYGGEGGHVVFLGGNVQWFKKAKLIGRDGKPTADIRAALPPDAVIANN